MVNGGVSIQNQGWRAVEPRMGGFHHAPPQFDTNNVGHLLMRIPSQSSDFFARGPFTSFFKSVSICKVGILPE